MGIKYSPLDHVKYFKAPFCKDNFSSQKIGCISPNVPIILIWTLMQISRFLVLTESPDYRQRCMCIPVLAIFLCIH